MDDNKWVKAIFWLFILAVTSPLLFNFVDTLVNPTTGIMVTGASASWYPDYLVAFVGVIPWLWPLGVIIGIIIMLSRSDKPPEERFPRV